MYLVHNVDLALFLSRRVLMKYALAITRLEVIKKSGICLSVRLENSGVSGGPERSYLRKVKWFDGVYYGWRLSD